MKQILNQLARCLGKAPFLADNEGKYHVTIDGESLFLCHIGHCLVVRSFLELHCQPNNTPVHDLLKLLLCQVTSWSRQYPQGLVLNHDGQLLLEARGVLALVDISWLERTLAAQVGILEQLKPQLLEAKNHHPRNQAIWRP